MARQARRVVCSEEIAAQLMDIVKSRQKTSGLSLRAKIILQCLEGREVKGVAKTYGVSVAMVIRWRNRFAEEGVEGLFDRSRSGRKPVYKEEFKQSVLKKLEQIPTNEFGQWNGALLAKELGYSKHAIWRLLREQRISLARKRSWCVNTDSEFVPKAADIVGLYLARNEKALVVCVDEKPNIQALEFRTGYVISSNQKLVRGIESTYRRNGTGNLFAALEVATRKIRGKTTDSSQKTKKGFLSFMEDLLRELPNTEEYHVILDNHSTHKRHELWLLEHKSDFFHYTPTNASWLNMVEIWLGILTLKSLRGASFSSASALCEYIAKFIAAYNSNAKPFVWRKREVKGSQLANNLRNLCN
jgi:transposase